MNELIQDDKIFYSEDMGEFQEGIYITACRYLMNNYKELLSLKLSVLKKDWGRMTDLERGNIRNSVVEVSLMVGSLVAGNLLAAAAEEDDDKALYTAAYMFKRMYGELIFYTPFDPSESLRVLRNPTATLNMIETCMKTLGQFISDVGPGGEGFMTFEQFQTGKRKGEYKSWHYFSKSVNPFYKLFDRDIKSDYNFLNNL